MQIAALIFDDITPLDIVGPMEVLSRLPKAEVVVVGKTRGPVRDPRTHWILTAEAAIEEVTRPDIVVIPGGAGVRPLCREPAMLDWMREVHRHTTWTTSVCTGSLLLAAAGLLKGLQAATHWSASDDLAEFGATYVEKRVVIQGKIITAAGVSSGIDMALTLAAKVAGEDMAKRIQLMIEYDPQPPFDSGAPSKADPAMLADLRQRMQRASAPPPR
ncbi:MAG TPA: DJ-1/PfpI family protein [Candidatus Cybelea sp.]|nr:DJ-1/PfpI family protein [Candidatus Cybelea sp.]